MVFRPEAESDRVTTHRKPDGASDGRAGNAPLEKLRTRPGAGTSRCREASNAELDVGKIEPDFHTAEVRALGANGRGDSCAQMAWWADVSGKLGLYLSEVRNFIHRGVVDFLLRVEAGAHGPFVQKVEQRTGFDETNGFCVWKDIQGNFRGHAAIEKPILGRPGFLTRALGPGVRARILSEEPRGDVIGFARVGEGQKWARAGDHAM